MHVFVEAVCGEDLAEDEEGGHGSVMASLLGLLRGFFEGRGREKADLFLKTMS